MVFHFVFTFRNQFNTFLIKLRSAFFENSFLDGNTFENSPSVDRKVGVLDANAGLTLSCGRAQIAYTINWRSYEFEGQKRPSLFGSVNLGYRF